jgi:hypothetical protein
MRFSRKPDLLKELGRDTMQIGSASPNNHLPKPMQKVDQIAREIVEEKLGEKQSVTEPQPLPAA